MWKSILRSNLPQIKIQNKKRGKNLYNKWYKIFYKYDVINIFDSEKSLILRNLEGNFNQ